MLIGRNIVSGTLHLRNHSIVVLLPSGGNRWRLLREKRSVKTPQEAIFADEEAEPSSRKAEPISGAFPSIDKQSTLLHGIMELDTLHHTSYRYHHSFKIKIGPHPFILRILYFLIFQEKRIGNHSNSSFTTFTCFTRLFSHPCFRMGMVVLLIGSSLILFLLKQGLSNTEYSIYLSCVVKK